MAADKNVVFGDDEKKKKKKEEEIKPQGFPRDSGRFVFCLTHAQQGQIRIFLGGGTE